MSRIKFVVDSAANFSKEDALRYDLEVLNIIITVGDKIYRENIDIGIKEIYPIIDNDPSQLRTAVLPPEEFLDVYRKITAQGYDAIVTISPNATTTGMFNSANIASRIFAEECDHKVAMAVIDTGSFSVLIRQGTLAICEYTAKGKTLEEVLAFAQDYYLRILGYCVMGSLDHLRRTGRISGAMYLAGGALDILPVVRFGDKNIGQCGKIRGKKKIVPTLMQYLYDEMDLSEHKLIFMHGKEPEYVNEMMAQVSQRSPEFELEAM